MFTGLVEEIGKLVKIIRAGEGFRLSFEASVVIKDMQIGSSVAVNGVCLTVVVFDGKRFSVDVIEETLKKNKSWQS